MKVVRGLSGIVAGGVVVLAVTVVGAAFLGARRGFPGPGGVAVTWHVIAALMVVAVQIAMDRRHGPLVLLGCSIVFLITGCLLWTQWWN